MRKGTKKWTVLAAFAAACFWFIGFEANAAEAQSALIQMPWSSGLRPG